MITTILIGLSCIFFGYFGTFGFANSALNYYQEGAKVSTKISNTLVFSIGIFLITTYWYYVINLLIT